MCEDPINILVPKDLNNMLVCCGFFPTNNEVDDCNGMPLPLFPNPLPQPKSPKKKKKVCIL